MASERSSDNGGDGSEAPGTRWEAYSDYRSVSNRVANSIGDALDAYALLESAHQENARINQNRAATLRQQILSAAMRLMVELEQDKESNEEYQEILSKWKGSDDNDGQLQKLRDAQLHRDVPDWMFEFVADIRRAGWMLGYLQAGRRSRQEMDDRTEEQARSMFE